MQYDIGDMVIIKNKDNKYYQLNGVIVDYFDETCIYEVKFTEDTFGRFTVEDLAPDSEEQETTELRQS